MDLDKKIKDSVEQFNSLSQRLVSLKDEVKKIETAVEQTRGKVVAYQELQQEQMRSQQEDETVADDNEDK